MASESSAPGPAEAVSSHEARVGVPPSDGPGGTAPRRWTSGALTSGVVVSAACFLVAGAAELLGVEGSRGDMTDVGALASGLVALTPWAWASLGTIAVVVTPALGLLVTAWEYASVDDGRTVLLALSVLGILVLSALVSILR